jgi:hypothetical protein
MKARVSVIDFENRTSKGGTDYQVLQCFATVGDDAGIAELRLFDKALFVDGDGDFVADWKIGVDRESKDIAPRVAFLERVKPGHRVEFGAQESGIAARFSALKVENLQSAKGEKRAYQVLEGVCHTQEGQKLVGVLRIWEKEMFVPGPGEYALEWKQARAWNTKELGGRLSSVKPLAGVQSLASMLFKGQTKRAAEEGASA